MATVNRPGVSFANSLVSSGKVDDASSWSFDASDGNRLLGPNGDDWERYGKAHLGIDPQAAEKTRERFKYPFAKLKGDTVTLFRAGVAAIRQRASQQDETDIFDAAGNIMEKLDKKQSKSAAVGVRTLKAFSFTAPVTFDLEAKTSPKMPDMPTDGMTEEEMRRQMEKQAMMNRPRFSIRGYTGVPMNVAGFYSPVIVDLNGLKAKGGAIPALLDHDTSKIIGQTDSVSIGADGVDLTGIITGEDANAETVRTHAKNGFKWQASIGAEIVRQEFLRSGEKTTVNGREIGGPMLIAREARLKEISFVALGADDNTTAAIAASDSLGLKKGAPTMLEKWLEAKGIAPDSLDDATRAALQTAYDAEIAATKTTTKNGATQTLEEVVGARRKEDERIAKITAIASDTINDRPFLTDEIDRMARAAIDNHNSVQEFELEVLRIRAHAAPGVRTRSDSRMGAKVLEAAICLSGGLDDIEKKFDEKTLNAASERFPRGIGLVELLEIGARENGRTGHISRTDVRGLLEAAFGVGSMIRANDGFSTLSIPGILSNIANKYLNAGFTAVESSWRDISSRVSVKDFKARTSYSLTGGAMYEKVGPAGELKHATLGELSYTNKAETYGKVLAITRQDIINDDLGALTQNPQKLGRGAALKLNLVFWTEFLADLGTFYTAGQGNVSTGAGSALASAGLQAAQLKFSKQTDPDGLPLGIMPRILLVPPELEITADELMTSLIVNTGGASTETKVPNRNVWANKYRTVMSTYLSNTAIANSSTTAWWLIADPADLPLIEVAFLNGRETPIVESADADFNTLGVQLRGYHDFGVAKQEYRAAVRSAGS